MTALDRELQLLKNKIKRGNKYIEEFVGAVVGVGHRVGAGEVDVDGLVGSEFGDLDVEGGELLVHVDLEVDLLIGVQGYSITN